MRRSRPQPIETVLAILLVAAALLTGVGVVFTAGPDPEQRQSLAANGGELPAPPDTPAPPASVDRSAPTTTTTRPADSVGAAPTTTATVPAPTVPAADELAPTECDDLVSETAWRRTGDRSALAAAAGGSAQYVELVTNRSDTPCRLVIDRCEATAVLLDADGTPTDPPPPTCTEALTEVVVEPDEARRVELSVAFPVPPGEYQVRVSRHDGTTALLPVVLDDRLPACDAESLSVRVDEGELFRKLEDIVAAGLEVALALTGAEDPCTLRVTESRVTLARDGEELEVVDETDRWSALEPGDDVRTHAVVASPDLEPGDHEGVITLVLDDGTELEAPFELVVG